MNATETRHDMEREAEMVPFIIGFFVDGMVLAIITSTCTKGVGFFACGTPGSLPAIGEYILAIIISFDNVIDGLGIAPIAQGLAPGHGNVTWGLAFAAAVVLGGVFGYIGRVMNARFPESRLVKYNEIATNVGLMTSVLLGALHLMPAGLSPAVLVGFLVVWFVLFVGERIDVVQYELHCCGSTVKLYDDATCEDGTGTV
jgi:hypothetical protein